VKKLQYDLETAPAQEARAQEHKKDIDMAGKPWYPIAELKNGLEDVDQYARDNSLVNIGGSAGAVFSVSDELMKLFDGSHELPEVDPLDEGDTEGDRNAAINKQLAQWRRFVVKENPAQEEEFYPAAEKKSKFYVTRFSA